LKVIFCIGESLAEREAGKMNDVLQKQIMSGLKEVDAQQLVVAYEPVWAIGTEGRQPLIRRRRHTISSGLN